MEQNITINVPSGKVVQQTTDESGNILIKFVDLEPIRSKSWEEFCRNHPNVKGEYSISISGSGISEADPLYKRCAKYHNQNLLATREDVEGIEALIKLTRLHDEWVGDWKPKYIGNNYYYFINYYKASVTIDSACYGQHFLSFPTWEMARNFLHYFEDLIETAKRFI